MFITPRSHEDDYALDQREKEREREREEGWGSAQGREGGGCVRIENACRWICDMLRHAVPSLCWWNLFCDLQLTAT